jgi:hypothetical protein
MMYRTKSCVAARWQTGGGKRLCQRRDAREQQRHKGNDSCEFDHDLPQFGAASIGNHTGETYPDASSEDRQAGQLFRRTITRLGG